MCFLMENRLIVTLTEIIIFVIVEAVKASTQVDWTARSAIGSFLGSADCHNGE